MEKLDTAERVVFIHPQVGWQHIDFREIREYRDLFFFLVWRQVKALYAQTVMGLAWAIINPLVQIVIFTIIFGKVAKVTTEGIPYFLYVTVSIVPWAYMSEAMNKSSQSLVNGQMMLGKIYFPRLIFPLAPVLAELINFAVSLVIILGTMAYFSVTGFDVLPTWRFLLLPVFILYMIVVPIIVGLWLSALSIRFRDVKFAMPFAVRMLMYSAPIVYSVESLQHRTRLLYSLNPIVGVIEGMRSCLLGLPFRWEYILPGMLAGGMLLVLGAYYFRRMERVFVDVI